MHRWELLGTLGGEPGEGTFSVPALLNLGTENQHEQVSEPDGGGVVGEEGVFFPPPSPARLSQETSPREAFCSSCLHF